MSNALAEAAESATLAILDLREALIRGNYSPKANSERRMIELSRSDIRRAQSKRTTP